MKERPILFQAAMVRAILAGTKTQTRRVVKPALPDGWEPRGPMGGRSALFTGGWGADCFRDCPYGQPGDQLWVRETFFAFGYWITQHSPAKGRDEHHFVDLTIETGKQYRFDPPPAALRGAGRATNTPMWWKRPAIHMKRAASRIQLEVTGVRVERLQAISEADSIAEGCNGKLSEVAPAADQARHDYRALWESINGPGSWDANPWVWCVEFRRLRP